MDGEQRGSTSLSEFRRPLGLNVCPSPRRRRVALNRLAHTQPIAITERTVDRKGRRSSKRGAPRQFRTRHLAGLAAALWMTSATDVSAQITYPATNPAPALQPLPMATAAKATPINEADPATRKREALRLIAIGRSALDRGDVVTAVQSARNAQSLNVPERQFAAGEPRVWQLLLDSESAAKRAGVRVPIASAPRAVQPAGFNQPAPMPAANAGFAMPTAPLNQPGQINQMVFTPGAGVPANGAIQQVQNIEPIPGSVAGPGNQLYQQGVQALTAGDITTARAKFAEAWKYEGQLDLGTRRQLKEKLTLLQPTKLPTTRPADAAPLTAIQRAELDAKAQVQRLYREVTTELANINEIKTSDPLGAQDQLGRLARRVDGANVDEASRSSLGSLVARAVADQKKYVEQNRAQIDLDLQNEAVRLEMATESQQASRIDQEVSLLVDQYNDLMDDRRFQEAEVIAKQVSELKPNDPISATMQYGSRMAIRLQLAEEIGAAQEDSQLREFNDLNRAATGMSDPLQPIEYGSPQDWAALSGQRLSNGSGDSHLSPREQQIKQSLEGDVSVHYRNRPLGEVLQDLSDMTGIPIVSDVRAMAINRVTLDTPVSLDIPNSIPVKSALNLILQHLDMTYVIENDVVSITSVDVKRSKVRTHTYRVADLVTPIPNFTGSYENGLAGALRAAYQMASPQANVQLMPVSATDIGRGMASGGTPASMNANVMGQYNPMGMSNQMGSQPNPFGGGRGGGSFADFDSLIELIQTTVSPETWDLLGGPSTMADYPQNLSLVISTTSDVHDQIVALLESLRKLQNLQITIEVRFITLSDTFFEQIGVDFDVQFDDNVTQLPDDDSGPAVSIGWDGINGLPTADLDIQFDNNSFGVTSPFGAPDAGSISTLGFAILSDIEAFFFLQAAQGDSRSNVMQAPKVTLFDGQIASIQDTVSRPFVTSITPVVGDFAVAQQPVIVILNEGTQLSVQGVVSDDKRYVRLTLVPFFSQIGDVNTFTFEGSRSTSRSSRAEEDTNGDGVVDDLDAVDTTDENDVISGTTVQLPTFASTSVSTTVSVPDGGTILLGGIKRLSEGRTERGVPMLSKIPYVSRLFRNVAIGRTANSLMLMVTPRIIIQEEEEVAQTGFNPNN